MEQAFSQNLANWTAFYALLGGMAATLLGLLFVALSLRLNIFHQREVADVRGFAAFAFITFLVTMAVAGLALAPHEHPATLGLSLLVMGAIGELGIVTVVRVWGRLNPPATRHSPKARAEMRLGWSFVVVMSLAYLGLVAVAILIWRGHPGALGWLGLIEGCLIGTGTVASWIMLSHAGDAPAESDGS